MRIGVVFLAIALLAACGRRDAPPEMVNQQTLDSSVSHEMKDADPTMALQLSLTGQQFADTVAASDAYEIAASQLAQRQATAPAIKDFAARMIQAHTQSTAELRQAAANTQPALVPNATLSAPQQRKFASLGALADGGFDHQFVRDQVEAHEAMLATLNDYAGHGDAPSLRDVARRLAPEVQGHLTMARNLPQQ